MFCGPFVSVGSGETFQHLVVSTPVSACYFTPQSLRCQNGGLPTSHCLWWRDTRRNERERERAVIFSFILFPYLLVISLLAKDLYVGAKRTQLREKSVSKPPPETRATIR